MHGFTVDAIANERISYSSAAMRRRPQLWDLRPISAHAHRMLHSAHFTRLGSRTPELREQCAAALIL
jgi:hypothetical protein